MSKSGKNTNIRFKLLKDRFVEFCCDTSIHGMSSIAKADNLLVCGLWIILVLTGFSYCIYCKLTFRFKGKFDIFFRNLSYSLTISHNHSGNHFLKLQHNNKHSNNKRNSEWLSGRDRVQLEPFWRGHESIRWKLHQQRFENKRHFPVHQP